MAVRNFTEEAYEQILQTIEQIDQADVNPVSDFFGDLLLRLAEYLEIFSVEQYREDMQTWHNMVLDSHNATVEKIKSIFDAAYTVDFEYREILDDTLQSILNYQNVLNTLRDVISGRITLTEGKTAANKFLTDGNDALFAAYDTILSKMESRTLRDSNAELIGDLLKLGAGFASLLIPTSPDKYVLKCKKFLDTFMGTLGDLASAGTIVLIPALASVITWFGVELNQGKYLDYRFEQLTVAQDYKDRNSTTDWLGWLAEDGEEMLAECPEDHPLYPLTRTLATISSGTYEASQVVDVTADAYEIVTDITDTAKDVDEWIYGKEYTQKEFEDAFDKKDYWDIVSVMESEDGPIIRARGGTWELISKVISERTGIPLSGWDDPIKSVENVFKTGGTLWSYGEKYIPDTVDGLPADGDTWDASFSKFKESKFLKDVFDFSRDAKDLVAPDETEAESRATNPGIFDSPINPTLPRGPSRWGTGNETVVN